nr:mitochondrial inner membrane protease subunit 2-like isoform X1 [Coffea arabica]XP_027065980.1 mitochondrial inner membrane protease subunit 2-like isoform X1 [Coffea arabica]
MGTRNFLWNSAKKFFTIGLIGLTVSDRYFSIVPVRGYSMSPTFNPQISSYTGSLTDDRVLVEKFCLEKYKFSCGDVVVFCSPSNHREMHIKRITALPGDWISTPHSYDAIVVPKGHCWVEGDNSVFSLDSRSFGPDCKVQTILEDIEDLKKNFESCLFLFVPRTANSCSHAMAQFAVKSVRMIEWEGAFPFWLSELARKDMGVVTPFCN